LQQFQIESSQPIKRLKDKKKKSKNTLGIYWTNSKYTDFNRAYLSYRVSILLSMAQYVIRGTLYLKARIRLNFSPSGFVVASLAQEKFVSEYVGSVLSELFYQSSIFFLV
jgi:hypothetical protein